MASTAKLRVGLGLTLAAAAATGAAFWLRAPHDGVAPTAAGGTAELWREFRERRGEFDSDAVFYAAYFTALRGQPASPDAAGPTDGVWFERAAPAPRDPHAKDVEGLTALGYVGGYSAAPRRTGLVHFDRERTFPGYNLYVSAHAPEALLTDLEGRVLHRWSMARETAFPQLESLYQPAGSFFRRARLLDDGDLLAVFDYLGAVRLGPGSELRWAYARAHHDMDVYGDRVYVLTFDLRYAPEWNAHGLLIEDYVDVLTLDGRFERRIDLRRTLERSGHAALLGPRAGPADREAPPTLSDPLHSNAIRVLDGSLAAVSPLYAAGNLLISMRNNHTIAILDPSGERVLWARSGPWRYQHDPSLVPGGGLLVFDNEYEPGTRSRVVELDPFTGEVAWQFAADRERPFYSVVCGAAQRLANGNTLITDSASGRAFELTAGGELVWAWISPHTAGPHGEWIALLPQLERIDASFPLP